LYFTYDTYNAYIKGYFSEYNSWVRDVFKPASLNDRSWLFWQYKNRGRVNGISNYVDINVFDGNIDKLTELTKSKQH
jgi:lysozyme